MTPEDELALFQLAQEVTDACMGAGTYVRLNHFDPSKGETHCMNLNGGHPRCMWCSEPVLPGEQARVSMPMHYECSIRSSQGPAAHIEKRCGCYVPGSTEYDPPGASIREAAKAAAAAFERTRKDPDDEPCQ